jgi:hypothetical protein
MGVPTVLNDAHRFGPAGPWESHVYGACSPGWHTDAARSAAIRDWIAVVREHDVCRVCSLLPAGDDSGAGYLARFRDEFGPDCVLHAPIPDGHLPAIESLSDDILPFLATSRDADERVVVTGLAGLGRTGVVLAAWLVSGRDFRPAEAISTVLGAGRDPRAVVERGDATLADLHALLTAVG